MRNDYGVTFNGRNIIHPGAYDQQDASSMVISSRGSVNVPIVVGTADAGEPGTVKWFGGSAQAREYLRGGDLTTALDMMFSPAPEGGGGASLVGVLIANETTKATLTSGGITYDSIEYGEGGNRIQVQIGDGTITGSKKFTAHRWDLDIMETYDNVGVPINIAYTGTSPYAVAEVTVEGNEATMLTINVGTDQATATPDLQLDLSTGQFTTVSDIVSYINTVSDYRATIANYASAGLPVSNLDAVVDKDITGEGTYLNAIKGDLAYQVNRFSDLVNIEVTSDVSNTNGFMYLSGGDKGTTPTSWVPHFDTIKREFSDILVVLSGSESIHAEALAHVQQMEQRNQKQTLFTGGETGEDVARTKERASMLNSRRGVLAYPGVYYKALGTGTPLAPYFTAAMIAGRVAGVSPSEPITFDHFNLVGLEKDLLAGSPEVDELITSGVATLERVQNGRIRLVEGITTYIGSNNSLYRQISVSRGADDLSSKVLARLEDSFLGTKGVSTTPSSVRTEVIDVLEEEKRAGNIFNYREDSIIVRFIDSVVYVDYQVAPVEPVNYILVTSHFVPESAVSQNQEG